MDREQLVGVGSVAHRLGMSASSVRTYERLGLLPPALRVDVAGRRVWRLSDIENARPIIDERRKARGAATIAA